VVQLPEPALAQAKTATITVQGVKGPTVTQVKAPHHAGDECCCLGRAVVTARLYEHEGRAAVCLDVVHVVTKALKTDQVMHRLPDDAGHRFPAHHAEQHDSLCPTEVYACLCVCSMPLQLYECTSHLM
jgi:hypothetical protein